MRLTLGYSPCPNDTFIFDALAHGKVDLEGLEFDIRLEDVETLNRWAMDGKLAVTKLSYHALGHLRQKYALLSAGSALGNNCGPLLISKRHLSPEEVEQGSVAIPGKWTTAHFLFSLAYPNAQKKQELVFSAIESAVLEGQCESGVIIHENRFTYLEKGLVKIVDLGAFWEESTGMPIPLGGIVVRRDLPLAIQKKVQRVLKRSVEAAFANPEATRPYVCAHAQEMDESVMQAHIALYVNEYSVNLGKKGRAAVQHLFELAEKKELIPRYKGKIFV